MFNQFIRLVDILMLSLALLSLSVSACKHTDYKQNVNSYSPQTIKSMISSKSLIEQIQDQS